MKHLIALILSAITFNGFTAVPPSKKTTSRYEAFQQRTVTLPTPFAKPFIIDKSDIELLAGKTIHHIDLVYTRYRSSPGFNQEALNNKRVAELKKLLPQIDSDKPTWAWIEQTGATDRETASTYFHGFVIHYSDKQEPNELRDFLSDKSKPMTTFTVVSEKGGIFHYASGTTVTIPVDAVTYADGTPVKGAFELQYREFRNPAEIALSGLPMTYSQKGVEYNFSSIGMYEIRGKQGDKELKLKKAVTVDFNCTKAVNDAAFYRMDDQTGNWKKIAAIEFDDAPETQPKEYQGARFEALFADKQAIEQNQGLQLQAHHNQGSISSTSGNDKKPATLDSPTGLFMQYKMNGDQLEVNMNAGAWKKFKEAMKDSADLKKLISLTDDKKRTLHIQPEALDRLSLPIFGQPIMGDFDNQSATLLAEGADANHTYPTIVRGLNSPSFGVYNADQIYRIATPMQLSPVYTDAATGKPINNLHVACVIDLTYNGSFSFQPNNLICNPNGRNVILLFTTDKRTYLLDESAFATTDKSGLKVNLAMKDVTAQLKTPEDLKNLLKL